MAKMGNDNEDLDDRETQEFDDAAVGAIPQGWKVEATRKRGPLATWKVMANDRAPSAPNVLALSQTMIRMTRSICAGRIRSSVLGRDQAQIQGHLWQRRLGRRVDLACVRQE